MPSLPEAFFLPVGPNAAGHRFCVYHRPHEPNVDAARAVVVYVHPFGEEINKCRRMAALQSRALAAEGYAVLQMDLLGCGDSSGDFEDATWDDWVSDVLEAAHWLQQRHHGAPLWFWGLRAGCLLAVDAAARRRAPTGFLLWQPPASGRAQLHHFLRIKTASAMMEGQGKGAMQRIREQIERGEVVDIGGYRMTPTLALGLERASMAPPRHPAGAVVIEVGPSAASGLSPVVSALANDWLAAGHEVRTRAVDGPHFWQTQEIEDAPQVITASVSAVSEMAAKLGRRAHRVTP
jgi:exosortase A-associated hydrolase 2